MGSIILGFILTIVIFLITTCTSVINHCVTIETNEIDGRKHEYMVYLDDEGKEIKNHFSECKFCKKQK